LTPNVPLALGRVKARAESNEKLEQLLELSRISVHGTTFRIETAFPLALIARELGTCAGWMLEVKSFHSKLTECAIFSFRC